jgi:hypothetical protein
MDGMTFAKETPARRAAPASAFGALRKLIACLVEVCSAPIPAVREPAI